jgi:thiol-disulfide isomerase/thioredoxin
MHIRQGSISVLVLLFSIFYIGSASGQLVADHVPGGPTDIKITFTYPPARTAKLIGFFADQNFIVDTILVPGNVLEYKRPQGLAQGLYYIAFSEKDVIQIIMDDDQIWTATVDLRDIAGSIKFDGSVDNTLMYRTAMWENSINPKLQEYIEKMRNNKEGTEAYKEAKYGKATIDQEKMDYIKALAKNNPKSLFAKYKLGGQNPILRIDLPDQEQVTKFRREFWETVDFTDLRLLYTPMIHNKLKRYIKDLTPQMPDSIISSCHHLFDQVVPHKEYYKFMVNWLLFQYEPGKSAVMDSEAIFVDVVKHYVTPERAFWADKEVVKAIQQRATEMAPSRLGLSAPNVVSKDLNGQSQELYNLKADYIVVYMFNPDCEHCQEQTPKLLEFFHKNRGMVDVFAIALDTDQKKLSDYITKLGLDWTTVHDPSNRSIYGKYWVDITPEIYLINKNRVLIGKNLKVNQIQTVIDRDKGLKK